MQKFIERRKKWVNALRSGKYDQTREVLFREYDGVVGHFLKEEQVPAGYCCLGVACKITGNRLKIHEDNYGAISKYYGLSKDETNDLIDLNDEKKFNFEQIAEYIEDRLINNERT